MHYYYKLYKPAGYLSQFINNQAKRKNKLLLADLVDLPKDAMAVGRLDENSEGLLLITNDGMWSDTVNRRAKVPKEYFAQVEGIPNPEKIQLLREGVELTFNKKKYTTNSCEVEIILETPNFPASQKKIRDDRHGPTSWLKIRLTEGKFRQVRKMTAHIGHPCLRLVRTKIGDQSLASMQPGDLIKIDAESVFVSTDKESSSIK